MTHRMHKPERNSENRSWRGIVLAVTLGSLLVCLPDLAVGATPRQAAEKTKPEPLIYSVKGPELFRTYCATCHGLDGKGGGPMASSLKATVPDLTVLTKKNQGQFPTQRVRQVIAGGQLPASHGSGEMPVWGPIFHQIENDQDLGNVRLENLVKYLQSIQQK
jgi:mono/diheme cytochrome c family protein